MSLPLFELKNISYRYEDGSTALNNCSLSIKKGSFTAVVGENGSGKTTLLLHLNGILTPESGEILFQGEKISYSRSFLKKLRSKVGFVFQNPDAQLFSASVWEDVSFGPMNLGLDKKTVKERVTKSLELVDMLDFANKPVHALSFGQKKRVSIAGVLAMEPEVVIMDEPMAGLDYKMQEELKNILGMLIKDGKTVIVATHDMDFAYEWADTLVVMQKGGCRAVVNVAEFASAFCDIKDTVPLPEVAELYDILTNSGLISPSHTIPRNLRQLLKYLRERLKN